MYWYPRCSTCRKAKRYLDTLGAALIEKDIVTTPPKQEELKDIIVASGLEIKKFFNTSGIRYRELGLSKKIPTMSFEEKIELLASDGMLIKRPLVTDGNRVTLGFNPDHYNDVWAKL